MQSPDVRPELQEQLIEQAVANYIDCLSLPQGSRVLIVTDDISKKPDPDRLLRTRMAQMLFDQLNVSGFRSEIVAFDHSTGKEEMCRIVGGALQNLIDVKDSSISDITATVVYLGDVWANRGGLYDAANSFGQNHRVRVAGSLGFKDGDCRVMSEFSRGKRELIRRANHYFEQFFGKHPHGHFKVITFDSSGIAYDLYLDYDTARAPFSTDLGWFNDEYITRLGNFEYLNIPGGEKFGAPFPFKTTQGEFTAGGIYFHITDGMIDRIYTTPEIFGSLGDSQRQLIGIINKGGRIPLSELGLGFYGLAGITTYNDCSVLSREKGGLHLGMGIDPSGNSPEAQELARLSGDFRHTDFVLDNNALIYYLEPTTGESIQFYRPQ